jgi:hypothetical protein
VSPRILCAAVFREGKGKAGNTGDSLTMEYWHARDHRNGIDTSSNVLNRSYQWMTTLLDTISNCGINRTFIQCLET